MDKEALLERFKVWALNVILLCRGLPSADEFNIIKRQLIRSATSSAANYSASNRGKSKKDLIYKRKIVEEELDESIVWLDMLQRLLNGWDDKIEPIMKEANVLLGIIVNSIKAQR
ncbi:MAG: four helix bundle protein [Lewinellaceae bacterium]|nr:four helix bundle protein [Lewinellaceae bacterium]